MIMSAKQEIDNTSCASCCGVWTLKNVEVIRHFMW